MLISIYLSISWLETGEAVGQTVKAFDDALGQLGRTLSTTSQIEDLAFALHSNHPIFDSQRKRASGQYHASTRTFYASAEVDYAAWIQLDWTTRVEAVGIALNAAAGAIHKTRISEPERLQVLALIAEVQRRVASNPPEILAHLQPIALAHFPGQSKPTSAGSMDGTPSDHVTLLPPEKVYEYLENLPRSEPAPEMFKRYKRTSIGLEYHEAWPEDEVVVEHWGICGERGQTHQYPASTAGDQRKILKELKTKAAAMGFKPIPLSRHTAVIVQRSIDGMGTVEDVDERHALEDFLNEETGWLGLGHCDGGSIGSGSMESYCYVVDAKLARAALARELAKSRFSAFSIQPPESRSRKARA